MFKKGNKFGKLNKGRKRSDLSERNKKGHSKETKEKISKSHKGRHFVSREDNPCPRCGSTFVKSSGISWKCTECRKSWLKNPNPKKRKVFNIDNPCPKCGSTHVGFNRSKRDGEYFACHDCKKTWIKNPKPEGWWLNNLPENKVNVSKEELKELYETMPQNYVAKKLDCSQSRISQLLKDFDIKARSQAAFYPHKISEEAREKMRRIMKGNTNWKLSHKFPNSEEKKLIKFFEKWKLPFKYVGNGTYGIDGKYPDFINEEKKIVLEFFGELWHPLDDEPKRIEFFEERGWKCLVIWGKETKGRLRKDETWKWESKLYDKIMRWLVGLDQ